MNEPDALRRIDQICRESPRWAERKPAMVAAWAEESRWLVTWLNLYRAAKADLEAEAAARMTAHLELLAKEKEAKKAKEWAVHEARVERRRADEAKIDAHVPPVGLRNYDHDASRACLNSWHELPIRRVEKLPPETCLRMESGRLAVDRLINWSSRRFAAGGLTQSTFR